MCGSTRLDDSKRYSLGQSQGEMKMCSCVVLHVQSGAAERQCYEHSDGRVPLTILTTRLELM